jgi:hypothetical protein
MVTLRIYTGNAEGQLVQQLEGTLHTVDLVYCGCLSSFLQGAGAIGLG